MMNLTDFRKNAALHSGGTSRLEIKHLVISILESYNKGLSLIDFGAGKGELLSMLYETGRFSSLSGVDLYERPSNLDNSISWHQQDLNNPVTILDSYDVVICSEVIEHLENPRQTFRSLNQLTKPGGSVILTMPNSESLRSYLRLIISGHFAGFCEASYPAHITALLTKDLERMCMEAGFSPPIFCYTNSGRIPSLTSYRWQDLSFGVLKGRLFSDNLCMQAFKNS